MNNPESCQKCLELSALLNDKSEEIDKLLHEMCKLKEKLLICETKLQNIPETDNFKYLEKFNTLESETQTPDDLFFCKGCNAINENSNKNELNNSNTQNVNNDYIYDEKRKMYYSPSTGYYYDKKKDALLDPVTNTYYKYDYSKQLYEPLYEQAENSNDASLAYSEDIINQVNNLKLNAEDHKSKNPSQKNEEDNLVYKKEEKATDENEANAEMISNLTGSTEDWKPPDGTNITVSDLVKETIEEHYGMTDYIYDEKSCMYFSQSTGYYYDTIRNLLYEPSTGCYYSYDSIKQTYTFFGKANLDVKCKSKHKNSRKNKRKASKTCSDKIKSLEKSEKLEVEKRHYSSPEEGEISDSESSSNERLSYSTNSPRINTYDESSSDTWPPCIRAIVEFSENLKIGSLLIITCTGGILGRDKNNDIFIPDLDVSRAHAKITYNNDSFQYTVEDLGSQKGTFINSKRLSKAKIQSEPHILNHGDKLTLGSCKLLIHIHEGLETCEKCEPGQILAELAAQEVKSTEVFKTKEEKEKERRERLRKLKKKYGLQGSYNEKNSMPASGYEDKAEIRRKTVGSQNPYEKDEEGTSIDKSLKTTNIGYKLLKKMGWKEGESLGTSESGILEPIPFQAWSGTRGLGSTEASSATTETPSACDPRQLRWVKAQERYFQLK